MYNAVVIFDNNYLHYSVYTRRMRRRVRKCSKGFERPVCAMFVFQSVRNLRFFASKSCNFA